MNRLIYKVVYRAVRTALRIAFWVTERFTRLSDSEAAQLVEQMRQRGMAMGVAVTGHRLLHEHTWMATKHNVAEVIAQAEGEPVVVVDWAHLEATCTCGWVYPEVGR